MVKAFFFLATASALKLELVSLVKQELKHFFHAENCFSVHVICIRSHFYLSQSVKKKNLKPIVETLLLIQRSRIWIWLKIILSLLYSWQ